LLDATAPRLLGLPALLAGATVSCAGLALGSRRVTRTTYRPDPWRWPEWVVCGCGLVPAVTLIWRSGVDAATLNPPFAPLAWPPLPAAAAAAVMVAALAGVAAPPPPRPPAPPPPARRSPAAAAPARDPVPA
jgi:energy-coupling factor transport system permease protein